MKIVGRAAVGVSALALGVGAAITLVSDTASQQTDDRSLFCTEFVPNLHASDSYKKFTRSAPLDTGRWIGYSNAICAGESPPAPNMTTLFGRALAAAGKMAVDPAPPPTTSTTTTTTEPPTTTEPEPPAAWPATFTNGPAGSGNILPVRQGVLLGTAPDGTAFGYDGVQTHYQGFEAFLGRTLDIEHRFLQGVCTIHDPARPNLLNEIAARGHIPLISWVPSNPNGGAILRGDMDTCIRQVGQEIGALPFRIFLRFCWESNGFDSANHAWMPCGNDLDNTHLTSIESRDMFRRAIDQLRAGGAFPRASLVWCPHEGYFGNGDAFDEMAAYPGDGYVDWVCSDEYHHDPQWCGQEFGWCDLQELLQHGGLSQGVEQVFRGRKPYMLGETGISSVSTLKQQWFANALSFIKTEATSLHAFVYFDVDARQFPGETANWRLDASQESLDGFKLLATDSYFDVKP